MTNRTMFHEDSDWAYRVDLFCPAGEVNCFTVARCWIENGFVLYPQGKAGGIGAINACQVKRIERIPLK